MPLPAKGIMMGRKIAYGIALVLLLLAFLAAAAEDNGWIAFNVRLWMLGFLSLAAAAAMATAVRYHTAVRYGPLPYAAIILITLTGMIHLFLGILGDWLLLANGLGYFALLCARYFPIEPLAPYHKQLTAALLGYTAITIVGYFVSHTPAAADVLGIGSKLIEAVLIGVLLLDWRSL